MRDSLPIRRGNEVELLRNGDQIFPAMLEAIRAAGRNICFETFVYWSGEIADEFARALAERASAGLNVHVIIDWYGSLRMKGELITLMVSAGVEVEQFRPLRWFNFRRANHRTHRKILVVDGMIAFTGGVGIADEWSGNAEDPDHWRDNHYRLRGPVVGDIQRAFLNNWSRVGHEISDPDDSDYFPALPTTGDVPAAVVAASPLNGGQGIHELFKEAIADARETLDFATAYFVPGGELVRQLVASSQRGVRVRVLLCGRHIDEAVVRSASRAQWGELIRAGIQIFEYEPTLYHVKGLIVDERWISIGSANFDVRSCRLNDELNVNIRCAETARVHVQLFDEDCRKARRVTLKDWNARPLWRKCLDWLALRFRRQL